MTRWEYWWNWLTASFKFIPRKQRDCCPKCGAKMEMRLTLCGNQHCREKFMLMTPRKQLRIRDRFKREPKICPLCSKVLFGKSRMHHGIACSKCGYSYI